ncbi:unnamed protein product [Owenia fusiformis]|uniref:Uncharacterized protein n=1 Tax=Owenia fusiformis TaxID=6347 RepID=A0A8S4P2S3_OWEFU|nr:unnamed protein product [Owenia fusiformis]
MTKFKCDFFRLKWIFVITLWLLFSAEINNGFNLDVEHADVFHGPRDSYFGFSITLHRNQQGAWLLTGAPKAESIHQQHLHKPGAVFVCPTTSTGSTTCEQLKLDTRNNLFWTSWPRFFDEKDNQWLGVSIDSQANNLNPSEGISGKIVICAHLWKDRKYKEHISANGLCYEIDSNLNFDSVTQLRPLIDSRKQSKDGMHYYAFGQAGSAVHFAKDGTTLMLGAVGLLNWTGGVVEYDVTDYTKYMVDPAERSDNNSYVGYSLSSGRFYIGTTIYKVAGAPRYNNHGKVYIYEGDFHVRMELQGDQIGEYFGASVCAIDLNNDGLDDLLVGAPLYSDFEDEGRVKVFINKQNGVLSEGVILKGSGAIRGRFGTSIAAAGDLNRDGYQDVAIGAPYEDNGRGAIYIYHGRFDGIHAEYSQRVAARSIDDTLRTFGFALSRGLDVDDNQYTDLAIGCYKSNNAVLLKTRPVVNLHGSLLLSTTELDLVFSTCHLNNHTYSCLTLTVQFKYDGLSLPQTINIQYSLKADTLKHLDKVKYRGYFSGTGSAHVSAHAMIVKDIPYVQKYTIIINPDIKDIITPLQFELEYSLDSKTKQSAHTLPPILNIYTQTLQIKQAIFAHDCGEDNICLTDLQLRGNIDLPLGNSYIILGYPHGIITLNLELNNKGETSYLTEITISYPKLMQYIQVETLYGDIKLMCIPNARINENDSMPLICELTKPMHAHSKIIFAVKFDISKIENTKGGLNVEAIVKSGSVEYANTTRDNAFKQHLPIYVEADVIFTGVSHPEQLVYKNLKNSSTGCAKTSSSEYTYPLIHTFDIMNTGPGRLPHIDLDILVPNITCNKVALLEITNIEIIYKSNSLEHNCRIVENKFTRGYDKPMDSNGTIYDIKFSTALEQKGTYSLDCTNAPCVHYSCQLGQIAVGESALIMLHSNLHTSVLHSMQPLQYFDLMTEMSITLPYQPGLIMSRHTQSKQVTTHLYPQSTSYETHLSWWIIPASAGIGLMILIIINIILWKSGFFKRKDKEDLQKLMSSYRIENTESLLDHENNIDILEGEDGDTLSSRSTTTLI